MKPVVFIDPMGTLLVYSSTPDPRLGGNMGLAPYGSEFMKWAVGRYDTRWLTNMSAKDCWYLASLLGVPKSSTAYQAFSESRVKPFEMVGDFVVLDTALIPSEIDWLAANSKTSSFIHCDISIGVTSATRSAIQGVLG